MLSLAGLNSLEDDSIVWSPKRNAKLGPRPPNTVGTLYQSCIALLVEHIEDVESLWGIPDIIKVCLLALQPGNSVFAICARQGLLQVSNS